jgi:hypothetical protein
MTPRSDFTEDELRRIEARWKSDVDVKIDRIDGRVAIIERLVWIAVGGTAIIAAITAIGISIVVRQGEKIDAVALRQAGVIMQADTIHKHQAERDVMMQEQIDRLRQGERR